MVIEWNCLIPRPTLQSWIIERGRGNNGSLPPKYLKTLKWRGCQIKAPLSQNFQKWMENNWFSLPNIRKTEITPLFSLFNPEGLTPKSPKAEKNIFFGSWKLKISVFITYFNGKPQNFSFWSFQAQNLWSEDLRIAGFCFWGPCWWLFYFSV